MSALASRRGISPRTLILVRALSATRAFVEAVEAADGQRLENAVLAALVDYANYRIPLGGSAGVLAGPRTFAGIQVQLVGSGMQFVNFVSGDYNRSRLLGNTVNKYIKSGGLGSDYPQNSFHHYVYARSTGFVGSNSAVCGVGAASTGATWLQTAQQRDRNAAGENFTEVSGSAGFLGSSRNNGTDYTRARLNDATTIVTRASQTPDPLEHFVYTRNISGSPWSTGAHHLALWSQGTALDIAAARTACIQFDNALTAAGL